MKKYMDLAILEAIKSGWEGHIPVGALLVKNNNIIGYFNNGPSIHHAEVAMRNFIYNNRIKNLHIYITVEPCVMCWFLLNQLHPYIDKITFGVFNSKYGAISNKVQWGQKKYIPYEGGLEENIIKNILRGFFYFKR